MNSMKFTPYYICMIINNESLIASKHKLASKMTILIFIITTLNNCSSLNYKILVLDYFDSNDKTLTMTNEIDLLTIGIKESFLNNDWQISIYETTEDSENINFSNKNTRYIMLSDYSLGNDLFYGDFIRDYNITIYDTNTNSELVILYGDGRTLESLLNELETVIESNYSN